MNYEIATRTPAAPVSTLRPLKPLDDRAGDASRDHAGAQGYSLHALERLLQDCTEQPDWRLRAKLCAAYYDGKQLTELQRWALLEEDLEERVNNLIRPIINSVLGQEAKSRTDVRIESDDDAYSDVAEVLNGRLKEAERETLAHNAVSNAYASMVKKGLGWLHVCRNSDPLAYPYRFEDVPIEEIWWDWRGQVGTRLDDRCKWLARMRMIDLDEVVAAMPQHRKVLEQAVNGWDDPTSDTHGLLGEPEDNQLLTAFDNERRFNTVYRKWDWVDTARKMVKLIEVWYRVPAIAVCIQISPTKRIEYNPNDPRHVAAVERNLVKLVKGVSSQVRRALYAGPHRLLDEGTTRKNFPYIPMFAYRDDEDGSPYGLIDGMIAPQDDYNDRHHRIQWMLKARQAFIEEDALATKYNNVSEVLKQLQRPDLAVVLSANRMNKNGKGVEFVNSMQLQKEQYEYQDRAEANIQKTAGRYGSNLGEAQVQSGVANQLLVEQGEQAMGEMNDNYLYARRQSFDQLVDLIREDHLEPNLKAQVGVGRTRRTVILNTWVPQPVVDETGQPAVDPATGQPVMGPPMPQNMVADADVRTALAETPNTPALRMQLQDQLTKIMQALGNNPVATNLLAPAYIEASNLSNRQEVADNLRRATGQAIPGDKQGQMQAEEAMKKRAAVQDELTAKKAMADIEEKVASTNQKNAAARKTNAEAERLERGIDAGAPELEAEGMQMQNAQTARAALAPQPGDDPVASAIEEASAEMA
jgi:hypothetical protein